jgi:hypothetical protein
MSVKRPRDCSTYLAFLGDETKTVTIEDPTAREERRTMDQIADRDEAGDEQ